jgi:orotidine-5'-phosphate decarboxylase
LTAFVQRLLASCDARRSLLCIGLDPDPSLMAVPDIAEFNMAIVDATNDLVCAYKPNLAFYEAQGSRGIVALEATVAHIRSRAPGVVVLGDAKRGDIGSTNAHYASALFDVWDFDAATVNWYAGGEAMGPFLDREDRGVFVWCRSSNDGAAELQDLMLSSKGASRRLFERVAEGASEWNRRGNVGLVVGTTYPDDLATVRSICPQMPILAPGVGAQGGALRASVAAGIDKVGRNLIVSSSRSILYASRDRLRFQEAARSAATGLRDGINRTLEEEGKGWPAT